MHRRRGKVNIYRSQTVVTLQAAPLHDVITLRMRGAKMTLEMNIVHTLSCHTEELLHLHDPFSNLRLYLCTAVPHLPWRTPLHARTYDHLVLHLRSLLYHRWLFPGTHLQKGRNSC